MSKYKCTQGTPPKSYRVNETTTSANCFQSSTIHDRRHNTNGEKKSNRAFLAAKYYQPVWAAIGSLLRSRATKSLSLFLSSLYWLHEMTSICNSRRRTMMSRQQNSSGWIPVNPLQIFDLIHFFWNQTCNRHPRIDILDNLGETVAIWWRHGEAERYTNLKKKKKNPARREKSSLPCP